MLYFTSVFIYIFHNFTSCKYQQLFPKVFPSFRNTRVLIKSLVCRILSRKTTRKNKYFIDFNLTNTCSKIKSFQHYGVLCSDSDPVAFLLHGFSTSKQFNSNIVRIRPISVHDYVCECNSLSGISQENEFHQIP